MGPDMGSLSEMLSVLNGFIAFVLAVLAIDFVRTEVAARRKVARMVRQRRFERSQRALRSNERNRLSREDIIEIERLLGVQEDD